MGDETGIPGRSGVLLTREVRWFTEHHLSGDLLSWFESTPRLITREQRIDVYDFDAALRCIGIKVRDSGLYDSKLLVSVKPDVELAAGLRGHVEDWLKITEDAEETESEHISGTPVEVRKDILTRRYFVNGNDGRVSAGCDVELASVVAGGARASTLCFETFGPPDQREEARDSGVAGLLKESPLPTGIELTPKRSLGYPEWIVRSLSSADVAGLETDWKCDAEDVR